MHVTMVSEMQNQTEQLESAAPNKRSSRNSILVLSVLAIGLNGTAAVYTMSPSDFALPNISSLADLLPQQEASPPNAGSVFRHSPTAIFRYPVADFQRLAQTACKAGSFGSHTGSG